MQISWQNCQENKWCSFMNVNLNHSHFDEMEGVYIIWQQSGPVIRIGQGIIKDRIADHRITQAITRYDNLHVTWAPVSTSYRDGVERYLADTLNPIVGDVFPDTNPIAVNLPWPWQS